jgi:STIMATE family
VGMKSCVFVVFEILPWIVQVGDWALRWTEGNEAVQIAFVMLIFPLIMNGIQYYIIDSFIKNKPAPEEEANPGLGGEDDALLADDEVVDEEEAGKEDGKVAPNKDRPLDPRTDSLAPDQELGQRTPEASSSGGSSNVEREELRGKNAR